MIVATAVFIVFAVAALGAGVAVFALVWAEKNRQFDDVGAGAVSIFDDEEPLGVPTDQVLAPREATAGTSRHPRRQP
jgi:cbb3-type cytochrome oxidase maturation protein